MVLNRDFKAAVRNRGQCFEHSRWLGLSTRRPRLIRLTCVPSKHVREGPTTAVSCSSALCCCVKTNLVGQPPLKDRHLPQHKLVALFPCDALVVCLLQAMALITLTTFCEKAFCAELAVAMTRVTRGVRLYASTLRWTPSARSHTLPFFLPPPLQASGVPPFLGEPSSLGC